MIESLLATCRTAIAGVGGEASAVALVLGLAGLTGGFSHCALMCGPFVLAQVPRAALGPTLRRLGAATLWPYHLGRGTTYVALAALAAALVDLPWLRQAAPWLLAAAGAAFLLRAGESLGWHGLGVDIGGSGLARLAGVVAGNRFLFGLVLGLLPCGLVYGALLAAAGLGSPTEAALAMAAFVLGTVPGLVLVGYAGIALERRYPRAARTAQTGLWAISGVALLAIAYSIMSL
ncbi:MAG: sulfite exporter TauE/SafE family protein [Alphaproteobacteria bacterium]|nr:sulfite exporter TauE/SafE family protein [Alphaproteobacteria bacterium]